jgi:hypothetical protein
MEVPGWLDEPASPLPVQRLEGATCHGFLCGRLLVGAILGRQAPEVALFDPSRVLWV